MAHETEKKGFAWLIGYIKNALSLKADKTEIPSLTGYATQTWVGQQGYQTAQQVQSAIASAAELPSGGSVGDFLRKTASGAAWETIQTYQGGSY